jgi:hypothetical protein
MSDFYVPTFLWISVLIKVGYAHRMEHLRPWLDVPSDALFSDALFANTLFANTLFNVQARQ